MIYWQDVDNTEALKGLKQENRLLKIQNKALEANNEFLSDCLIEMSEVVYGQVDKVKNGDGSA